MDSTARPPQQLKMASSTGGTEGSSPASSPASAASLAAMASPKYGTLVPNRIFVGGISASTSEAELAQVFSAYGNVKSTKIIADRGGVSKGYGFVTFETEEEAKRLQNEPECIVLRERKLNIAPAIKKQPFNRSFDGGSGSPTAMPANTYYYSNGLNLSYQNGIPLYNTGAPAPGTTLAVPSDPTALYQAAGVFGPQVATGHQPFTPMVYPVPAPSLYMPQQYPYASMPYEPYFPGAANAAGASFIYTTNGAGGAQTSQSGVGGGNGSGSASNSGTNSSSYQSHYYGGGPGSHLQLSSGNSGGHQGGPPPPQMELYYSYSTQPHHALSPQHPSHHSGPMSLSDQQMLMYSDIGALPPQAHHHTLSDSQLNHAESPGMLSHQSESQHQQHQQHPQHQAVSSGNSVPSDSGGGAGPMSVTTQAADQSSNSATSSKYSRYHGGRNSGTFHPLSHLQEAHQPSVDAEAVPESKVSSQTAMHYRGAPMYPTVYVPPYSGQMGASLLPTPNCQPHPYDGYASNKYSKGGAYGSKQSQPLMHGSGVYMKQYPGQVPPPPQSQKYPRVTTPPGRLQQLGRRPSAPGPATQPQMMSGSPSGFYMSSQLSHKPPFQFGGGPRGYIYHQPPYAPGLGKAPYGFDYSRHDRQAARRPNQRGSSAPPAHELETAKPTEAPLATPDRTQQNTSADSAPPATTASATDALDDSHSLTANTSTHAPPRPAHSPSPTPSQVQLFGSNQQQQQQQRFSSQQRGGRPYTSAPRGGGISKGPLRQQPKFKLNGIVQSPVGGKQQQVQSEDASGDAPSSIGRLPLTPPGTPQQQSPNSSAVSATDQKINESLHQLQALSL